MNIRPRSERLRQPLNDACGLDADMHDPANRCDQVSRVFEPAIGIVDNAARLVARDPVAVDEPLQRRPAVDLISVRRVGDAAQTHVLVDAQDRLFIGIESHRALADPEMLRSRLSRLRKHDVERIFFAGLIIEMEFRECAPGLGKGMKIGRERNPREILCKIVREPRAVAGRVKNAVDVVKYGVLVDGIVLVSRTERG